MWPPVAASSLCLMPALDCLGHSWIVIPQSDPDLLVIDAVICVRGDDPHALDFSPWNLRRRLDDLVWQLGSGR
jgi:hypothetical protein